MATVDVLSSPGQDGGSLMSRQRRTAGFGLSSACFYRTNRAIPNERRMNDFIDFASFVCLPFQPLTGGGNTKLIVQETGDHARRRRPSWPAFPHDSARTGTGCGSGSLQADWAGDGRSPDRSDSLSPLRRVRHRNSRKRVRVRVKRVGKHIFSIGHLTKPPKYMMAIRSDAT